MKIELRSDRGMVRILNEDSVQAKEIHGGVFIVLADGLGGHNAGEVASKMVTEGMISTLSSMPFEQGNEEHMMTSALQAVNRSIYAMSLENKEQKGMGATVVCAWVFPETLHLIHAGDSRAYWIADGTIEQLTKDHSVSNDYEESVQVNERIRHMVTRAMGTEETIRGDYKARPIDQAGILLLCSDGLTNECSDEMIAEVISQRESLAQAADTLIEKAKEHGGKDNITVALLCRKEETE